MRDQRTTSVEFPEAVAILKRRRRSLLLATLAGTLAAVVVAMVLTPVYRAETRILPPPQRDPSLATYLLGQAGGVPALLGMGGALKSQGELYVEMLKTRTILDRVVERFDLGKVYKTKYREDARKRLLRALRAEEEKKSGVVTVSVEDTDPARAAALANAFIEELRSMAGGLAVTEAAERRSFFEEQLRGARSAMSKAEEELRGYQEKTGALQIDEQAKAVIEGIANLRAQVASREVHLKVLRSFATGNNPEVLKTEEELRGLRAELAKMEGKGTSVHDPLMPTERMPGVGAGYYRRLRDLKYNETLFELLAKQHELARLDEARNAPVIQVLDAAVAPERKIKPRRALIVLSGAFASFFLAVFVLLFLEGWNRSSATADE